MKLEACPFSHEKPNRDEGTRPYQLSDFSHETPFISSSQMESLEIIMWSSSISVVGTEVTSEQ